MSEEVDFSEKNVIRRKIYSFIKNWWVYSQELRDSTYSDYRSDYMKDVMKISNNRFDNLLLSTHSDNIRDEVRNKYYNRFDDMGRLSRYRTYEFINNGENLEVVSYKHSMRTKSLKSIIKRAKRNMAKHVKFGLPLPLTKDCQLIGVANKNPRRSVSRKRTYERDSLVEYFNSKVDTSYQEDEFNYIGTYNGDWQHSSQNLIDMAKVKPFKYSVEEMVESLLERSDIDFKLPYVGEYSPKLILGLDVKPKAFPGFSTSEKIAKFRKDSSPYTKDYAYKYCERIMKNERQILDTSLIVVGGREKRVKFKDTEKDKRVKTRVTCMMEDVPTLISQSLVNPITNCIPEIKDHHSQLAKVYGQGNMLTYKETMQPKLWNEVLCDLDYSGHDNNTTEEQIVVAFAFLRLCFKESVEIDRLFYYCMSSMISKRVVLPESNLIYKLSKGVSTGHGFTSLITTICAYTTLATGIFRVLRFKQPEERARLLRSTLIGNAGDDCNLKLPVEIVNDLYEDLSKYSGHTVDDIRESGYIDSNNELSRVTFLKKQFFQFSWNSKELFTNLLYPTVSEKNFGHRADNLKVLLYQSPLNTELNNKLICLILCYILSGRGYGHQSMIEARLNGQVYSYHRLIDDCNTIGFSNPLFIDELMKIDYGEFKTYFSVTDKDTKLGSHTVFGNSFVSVDFMIKQVLSDMKKTIKQKISWFTRRVKYKMHKSKNTLTVYDYMKTYTRPKSNNISYESLRIYYNSLHLRL